MTTSEEKEYPYVWPKFFLKLFSRSEDLTKYFNKKGLNELKEISTSIFGLCESISEIDGTLDLNYSEYEEKKNTKFIQRMKPMLKKVKEKITLIDTLVNNLRINISKEKTLQKEEKARIIESIDIFKRDLDKLKILFMKRDELISQEIRTRATK